MNAFHVDSGVDFTASDTASRSVDGAWSVPNLYGGPQLRAWQTEALHAWYAADRRGVIQAVTGTGKSAIGVVAAAGALTDGRKVLILVPGVDLVSQWLVALRRDLRGIDVGVRGDGHGDGFDRFNVVVATVQSASRRQMLRPGQPGLLIADEVHHYGAGSYRRALEPEFTHRLGLTATYERSDRGIADVLDPYFGGVVASCDYRRGLDDGILARFRVGFIPVTFTVDERRQYEEQDEKASKKRGALLRYGLTPEPFGTFMAEVTQLSKGGDDGRAVMNARIYLSAFAKRRGLVADSSRKLDALKATAPMIHAANQALIFCETKETARKAAENLAQLGLVARDISSDHDRDERSHLLDAFRRGFVKVLAAPRVLDEGVDVPEADVAIIMAASSSRRQMIQRMGRVIRPKLDGHRATFLVMYVEGTREDPATGAHEGFIDQLIDVADDVHGFSRTVGRDELLAWFGAPTTRPNRDLSTATAAVPAPHQTRVPRPRAATSGVLPEPESVPAGTVMDGMKTDNNPKHRNWKRTSHTWECVAGKDGHYWRFVE